MERARRTIVSTPRRTKPAQLTPKIYIDSNLGDNIKGEIESEKIFNLGFKNLYLATGYGKEFIQKPPWIIEVLSKGPEIIERH